MKIIERRVHTYTLVVDVPGGEENSTERLIEARERVDALAGQFRQAVADRCGLPLARVGTATSVTRDVHTGRVSYHVQATCSAVTEEQWPELAWTPAAAG